MPCLEHGGHVLDDAAKDAGEGDVFLAQRALPSDEAGKLRRTETPFDHLLPRLKARPGSRLPGDPGRPLKRCGCPTAARS